MPVEIKLPDGSTQRTDDWSVDDVIAVAKECETTWAHVQEAPHIGDGTVMKAAYLKACELGGVEPPARLTAAFLAAQFTEVEDDRPTEYDQEEGGSITVSPSAGDAPATT